MPENNIIAHCDGCDKKCKLGATKYKPIFTPSFYRPTIQDIAITKYTDEQGTHHISTTGIDSYETALKTARYISTLCPHYKTK